MRKLLFKSPEFSIEDASNHPRNLSLRLKEYEEAGDKLREEMSNLSIKKAGDLTDRMVLRIVDRSA
ncbi:MAG: hypothetical protein NTW35_00330 [Candidatus Nomurabacteria bacterium]|nr:hypothetical protein [Candidatus Nomurabacteria bacterium]